jgi:hypothetical protein
MLLAMLCLVLGATMEDTGCYVCTLFYCFDRCDCDCDCAASISSKDFLTNHVCRAVDFSSSTTLREWRMN